jgi:hypothetical protein
MYKVCGSSRSMRGDASPHTLRSHPPFDLQGECVFSTFGNWERARRIPELSLIITLSFDIQQNPTLQLAPNLHIIGAFTYVVFPHIGARRVIALWVRSAGRVIRDSGDDMIALSMCGIMTKHAVTCTYMGVRPLTARLDPPQDRTATPI